MGEKEDQEKAAKLAAAKKRVAQLQKKKKAASSETGADKSGAGGSKAKGKAKKEQSKDDADQRKETEEYSAPIGRSRANTNTTEAEQPDVQTREELEMDGDSDEAAFNEAIKAANEENPREEQDLDKFPDAATSPPLTTSGSAEADAAAASRKHSTRQPSISLQSKMRSTSFRQSNAPSTTEGGSPDDSIFRKQTQRISELEEENKRLAKEAADGETRWRKSEEELEELREKAAEERGKESHSDEIQKLQDEISSLRRASRASVSMSGGRARQGSVTKGSSGDETDLKKELEAKDSTISDLQLEVSRLRSQVSAQDEGTESRDEQVTALQANLNKAEANNRKLEGELADSKKALNRASEKAVKEGTEKTSKEIKIKSLERENEELKVSKAELERKGDALEKKIEAMNKLHRETEQRTASKLSTAEAQGREAAALKNKIESLEKENIKLREAKKRDISGGADDEGLDELEDEERQKLEKKIRDLEGEIFELRRGVWRDKRKELQPGMADGAGGDDFDDVDLSASGAPSRRRSTASQGQTRHSGFTQVLNSGIAAFRGANLSPDSQARQQGRPANAALMKDFDDDDGMFDEQAFMVAQREEEMRKMVEHVREVKKGLKNWVGWRLDLVDSRKGGGGWGAGAVFDI